MKGSSRNLSDDKSINHPAPAVILYKYGAEDNQKYKQ